MGDRKLKKFYVGDYVKVIGGDYEFEGFVVASFTKRKTGLQRYVVEDSRGLLLIQGPQRLEEIYD